MSLLAKNLKYLTELSGISQAEISRQLGFSRSAWNNYLNGVSKPVIDDLYKILGLFKVSATQILEEDLRKGKFSLNENAIKILRKGEFDSQYSGKFYGQKGGEKEVLTVLNEPRPSFEERIRIPYIITVDTQGNENVVFVPVKARAGYLNGYADPEFMHTLPAYRLPGLNNGTFRIFEVEGVSMYPTLNAGDMVIGSNVEQMDLLRDDRVHVLVTKNEGVVVKRVLNRLKQDGKLILKSDNYKDRDLYPPIVVDPGDILEVWYATGYISRQMRPPAEMYNRLIDLEGRLTLLEETAKKARSK